MFLELSGSLDTGHLQTFPFGHSTRSEGTKVGIPGHLQSLLGISRKDQVLADIIRQARGNDCMIHHDLPQEPRERSTDGNKCSHIMAQRFHNEPEQGSHTSLSLCPGA